MKGSNAKIVLVSPGFVDTSLLSKGRARGFPKWLEWMISTPEEVAREIARGLKQGREEIFPTLNGKAILRMHRLFPRATLKSSRVLLTQSLKDLILRRYTME